MAPAIMVGDELVVQGCDIDEDKVEAARRLNGTRRLSENR
jgi:hypothetical protein